MNNLEIRLPPTYSGRDITNASSLCRIFQVNDHSFVRFAIGDFRKALRWLLTGGEPLTAFTYFRIPIIRVFS